MLACIACSKPELEEAGGGAGEAATSAGARAGAPGHSKDAVKSLTTQIKDMVLKFSGMRQCKGGTSGGYRDRGIRRQHHRTAYLHHDEDDAASDGGGHYAYLTAASSTSTPAWDFTSIPASADSRFGGGGGVAKWIPGVGEVEADVVLEEDNGEPKEWMAQVEPGVHITFMSLPGGAGNDLKRIRFNREMFNKWQAQRWWGENYDRIMELYNVQRFSRQALTTPPRSDDGDLQRESVYSRVGSTRESPATPPLSKDRSSRNTHGFRPPPAAHVAATAFGRGGASSCYLPSVPDPTEHIMPAYYLNPGHAAGCSGVPGFKVEASSVEASRTTTSSRDEAASVSISNASDMEMTEWVEQDEPGVYITIREVADGTRELRRVRFSREKFGEVHAKLWWEENRERIQAQYL